MARDGEAVRLRKSAPRRASERRNARKTPFKSPSARCPLRQWLLVGSLHGIIAFYRIVDRTLCWFQFGDRAHARAKTDIEPDVSCGPILLPEDAPRLFRMLDRLARRLGGRPPEEVRLSHLPVCGVIEVAAEPAPRRVLLIGLPCLQVLGTDELRAVLAHELAHLRHDDTSLARDVSRFSLLLNDLESSEEERKSKSLRQRWAALCAIPVKRLSAAIARTMEFRADLVSARTQGSGPLASAIEKMAVVQPVFDEILARIDDRGASNVYRLFGRAWTGLRGDRFDQLRDSLIGRARTHANSTHPSVAARLNRLRRLKRGRQRTFYPSLHLLADPRLLERLLHNHLLGGSKSSDNRSTTNSRVSLSFRQLCPSEQCA